MSGWLLFQRSIEGQEKRDPASWGTDHVGRARPELVAGDECLFCHRNDIGPGWQRNAHGLTLRQREGAPDLAPFASLLKRRGELAAVEPEVGYFLGSRTHVRFLKKVGYGRLALLETRARFDSAKRPLLVEGGRPDWDSVTFGDRCAGCHASGVDSATRTFASIGLECYTCHGVVPLEHSSDTARVWLSKKRRREAQAVTSICAQCHVRTGRSRSSGLPYANNFVAGDNLFKDFEVDFARADDPVLNPGDRHVPRNIRDVAVRGLEEATCLSCHQLHTGSTVKHRKVLRGEICLDCHAASGPMKPAKSYEVHSELCQY